MEELEKIKSIVEKKVSRKLRIFEDSYVKEHTAKKTQNCLHHGRCLSKGLHVCKILSQGANESESLLCHDEKASRCEDFQLKIPVEKLRDQYLRIVKSEEISVRYPSVGELLWVLKKIQEIEEEQG